MTIEQMIEQEMTPCTVNFWGQTYENFHPNKIDRVFGDGKRLMYLMPMSTRPWYYIAQIDSKYPADDKEVSEFVDQLLDAIDEQFGSVDDDDDDENDVDFPSLNIDSGYVWGFYKPTGIIV